MGSNRLKRLAWICGSVPASCRLLAGRLPRLPLFGLSPLLPSFLGRLRRDGLLGVGEHGAGQAVEAALGAWAGVGGDRLREGSSRWLQPR